MRGELGGWDVDVSLVYGHNEVLYGVEDSLNISYRRGLADRASMPASMNTTSSCFNAGVVHGFEIGGLPEPLNLAFGVEARRESYGIEAGEPASYNRGPIAGAPAGAQGFPGFQPSNELDEDRTAVTAPTSTSKRSSPRNSSRASPCAAKTIPTSAPP